MTDEIGISPERPVHFECNQMSQWTLACGNSHPAGSVTSGSRSAGGLHRVCLVKKLSGELCI